MPALRTGDEDRTLPVVKQGGPPEPGGADACAAPHQAAGALPAKLRWSKSWKKRGYSAVLPPTLRSPRPFRDRGYVRVENRRFCMRRKWAKSSPIGWKENFRDLMNYDFTAQMEDRLDQVANRPGRMERGAGTTSSAIYHSAGDRRERSGRGRHAAEPDGAYQHRLPDLWT